jgi:hypothetical protein
MDCSYKELVKVYKYCIDGTLKVMGDRYLFKRMCKF